MEEGDAIDPLVARQDLVEDLMEGLFRLRGRIEELEAENGRLRSKRRFWW